MKLYKISQTDRRWYDVYDSAIVAAESEALAKEINPDGEWNKNSYRAWADCPDKVKAEYIGEACEGTQSGVILASFNAG